MKLREVGGALAMTAVITTGCSENVGADLGITEATRPSKDQIYEIETPYTKARDCAVDLARIVFEKINLPIDAATGTFSDVDPAAAKVVIEPNGSATTFTYGLYADESGNFENPDSNDARYFVTGQVSTQLNQGETPMQAIYSSDPSTLGVVAEQQQIQIGRKSHPITAETNPDEYCNLSTRVVK